MTPTPRQAAKFTDVHARRYATALLLAGSLAVVSSCSDRQNNDARSPDIPSARTVAPSKLPSSPAHSEEALVIAAYTSSWTAQTEAYSKASTAGTDLRKTTTFKALADIESDLSVMRKARQVTTGEPAINPKVVKVTAGKLPTATIEDCVDTTHWTLIDKASKKPVPLPTTRLIKYVSIATLEKWGTKWMVTKLTAQAQSC
ncbi:hypothetical protein ABZ904_28955 [Streptomyces sp. NPDC046900]|uniref:hypothetical protein n=1 Tax=Streptomyces sp. NPDC046900 TaxID=3155473 RepID=UPI0033FF21C4